MKKNLIKYCKGHFETTNNIYSDMRNALILDGYSKEMSDNDVFEVVKNDFVKDFKGYWDMFLSDIQDSRIYEFGYFTKTNCNLLTTKTKTNKFPKYDYRTAVLYRIRSYYRWIEISELPENFLK